MAVGAIPLVVLTSTGSRTGQPRDTPLLYFTDDDDIVLIASSYGRANPKCELHVGARGGPFVARETGGAERDRLFALAVGY